MIRNWSSEQSSRLDESSIRYTSSKTRLLDKHIEALALILQEVLAMEQDLEVLLEAQLNSTRTLRRL